MLEKRKERKKERENEEKEKENENENEKRVFCKEHSLKFFSLSKSLHRPPLSSLPFL